MKQNPTANDTILTYTLFGCVSGCKSRLPDTTATFESVHPQLGTYNATRITPHCLRCNERALLRKKIYHAAEKKANEADNKCKTLRGKLRARTREWEKATKPWVIGPCPFFESEKT